MSASLRCERGTYIGIEQQGVCQQSCQPHFCLQVLGDEIIKKLNSDKWDTREEALRKIKDRLGTEGGTTTGSDGDLPDRLPFFNACCCVMRKAMNDKVAPVYFAACSLLDALLETCANDLNNDDIQVWGQLAFYTGLETVGTESIVVASFFRPGLCRS